MLHNLLATMQKRFVSEGGIKERMHQARTGFRQQQDSRLAELERAVPVLQRQLAQAQAEAALQTRHMVSHHLPDGVGWGGWGGDFSKVPVCAYVNSNFASKIKVPARVCVKY